MFFLFINYFCFSPCALVLILYCVLTQVRDKWGGVDSHLDYVYYYPTHRKNDGTNTILWGGYDKNTDTLCGASRYTFHIYTNHNSFILCFLYLLFCSFWMFSLLWCIFVFFGRVYFSNAMVSQRLIAAVIAVGGGRISRGDIRCKYSSTTINANSLKHSQNHTTN